MKMAKGKITNFKALPGLDSIRYIYLGRWYIVGLLALLIPLLLVIRYAGDRIRADSSDEPYSIFIIAGQSLAAGVASYREELPEGTGLQNQHHPADTATNFWWAGSNGKGIEDAQVQAFFPFYNASGQMGWDYSGGSNTMPGSQRLLDNLDGPQTTSPGSQTSGLFGPEFGVARTLYEMGRRKVIILKVTYGFQSLGQSNSPLIPFDWNVNSVSNDPDKPKSYTQLKNQFTALTEYLNNQNLKYTVDGIFWMQGETDTLQDSYANAYKQNLTDLVAAAKEDLQLHPQAHFVIGKTNMNYCIDHSWPRYNNYCDYPSAKSIDPVEFVDTLTSFVINPIMSNRLDKVRLAQQEVADSDQATTQKVDIFETGDLPRGYDWTHLTAPGQLELGRRFVTMYRLPQSFTGARASDYDEDGLLNSAEDTGRGSGCPLVVHGQTVDAAGNGNLGDDDADCDGYPNYLDKINGPGSGL